MKRRNLLIGAAALAAATGLGAIFWQAAEPPQTYPHITLDSSTLSDTTDSAAAIKEVMASETFKGLPVMVEFIAGWCPHCADLKPEMDKVMAARAGTDQPFGRLTIIVQEGDHLTGERGAFGYVQAFQEMTKEPYFPQVQLWKNGKLHGYFVGERSAAEIETFIDTKLDKVMDKALDALRGIFPPAPKPD